jgi:hypothetical protein
MDDHEKPVGEVLGGLTTGALPDGWTPLDALCLVKCTVDDGAPRWAMRFTDGINNHELLGALVLQTALLTKPDHHRGSLSEVMHNMHSLERGRHWCC